MAEVRIFINDKEDDSKYMKIKEAEFKFTSMSPLEGSITQSWAELRKAYDEGCQLLLRVPEFGVTSFQTLVNENEIIWMFTTPDMEGNQKVTQWNIDYVSDSWDSLGSRVFVKAFNIAKEE